MSHTIPKGLAASARSFAIATEPEMKVIEEVKTTPIHQTVADRLAPRPEEDGGGKDALEALHHAPIVAAIFGKAEEFQHL